jgi:radical SAM superfamily enzyme YgiQ (UPF0313 family)
MIDEVTLASATLGEDGKAEPPIGPLYVAAAFEERGVRVDFRDYQLAPDGDGYSGERFARFLDGHAELVAISCFVDMLPVVIDAARRLVAARPDTRILLGGPGPTAKATQILERYPWIHGVVRGEGEETVHGYLDHLRDRKSLTGVPGMVMRRGGAIVDGGDRARTRDIDALPLPAYHLIDWSRYASARMITTRGCSYRCSFCDVTALWGNRSVFRSTESAVLEAEMLRDRYGQTNIGLVDDTFVLNRDRVRAFCDRLIERRSGIEWGCFGRINLMTPELVERMAEAGCRAIFYGIDSGSQTVLDQTLKKMKLDDILPALEVSAKYFDRIEASFIWGYPFESYADFQGTLEVASAASSLAPKVSVQLHMLSPLPMSPIYRDFSGKLLPPEEEDRDWLLLPALLLDERAGEVGEIVRADPDIHPGFYTFPTPDKKRKRRQLQRVMDALHRTIGSTLFDARTAALFEREDRLQEKRLLAAERRPSDRIGVGLGLGFFQRRRRAEASEALGPLEGRRGARMVRERNDARGSDGA